MVDSDITHYGIHSGGFLPMQDVHSPMWRAFMTNMQKYLVKKEKKILLFLVVSRYLTSKEQV